MVSVTSDESATASWRLQVRGQIVPRIELTPALLHLLNTPAGSTVERVVTLASNDDEAFRITRIDGAVPGLLVEPLAGADGGKTASVRCRFTAPATPGSFGGVVSIITDRPAGGTVGLRVIGTVISSGGPS
jgi:hypothetical protein